jgi:hypothetical protein
VQGVGGDGDFSVAKVAKLAFKVGGGQKVGHG